MISIISTFRSFDYPKFALIQDNAIRNWLTLNPTPEIIIAGNENGVKEICEKYNLIHIPDIKYSLTNVPFLNDIFEKCEAVASHEIMLLISGDILLDQTTIVAASRIKQQLNSFCVCAKKREIVQEYIEFKPGWKSNLNYLDWRSASAGDYFLYNKGFFENFPPFIVGRCSVDNYLFWYASNKKCLIDGSETITVLHPEHDYIAWTEGDITQHADYIYNRTLYHQSVSDFTTSRGYATTDFANYLLTKGFKVKAK